MKKVFSFIVIIMTAELVSTLSEIPKPPETSTVDVILIHNSGKSVTGKLTVPHGMIETVYTDGTWRVGVYEHKRTGD